MTRCRIRLPNCWVLQAVLVIGSAALMGGCSSGELRTTPLTASRHPFVRDIPVPMSFERVDDLSESYRTQAQRVIRHAYFGQAEPITVYAFYREEMPHSGWRLLSDSNSGGMYNLMYNKGSELATVQISRETRSFHEGALVTVRVKPVGALIGPD